MRNADSTLKDSPQGLGKVPSLADRTLPDGERVAGSGGVRSGTGKHLGDLQGEEILLAICTPANLSSHNSASPSVPASNYKCTRNS